MSENLDPASHETADVPPSAPISAPKKEWYKKPSRVIPAAVIAIAIFSSMSGNENTASPSNKESAPTAEATSDTTTDTAPAAEPTEDPVEDPSTNETVSQSNAVEKAQSYIDYDAFSRKGLIDQLKFEGFSTADATYGVDAITVDWNEQAAKKAKDYLDYDSFSRSGLIDQLEFEGFTPEQASYGATAAGL